MFRAFENGGSAVPASEYVKKKRDVTLFSGDQDAKSGMTGEILKQFRSHSEYMNIANGYVECLIANTALANNSDNCLFRKNNLAKTDTFDYYISVFDLNGDDLTTSEYTDVFPYDPENVSNEIYDKYVQMLSFDKNNRFFRRKIISSMARNFHGITLYGNSAETRIERSSGTLDGLAAADVLSILPDADTFNDLFGVEEGDEEIVTEETEMKEDDAPTTEESLDAAALSLEYQQLIDDDVDDVGILMNNLFACTPIDELE